MNIFSLRLKNLRIKNKLTQRQVADRLNISRTAVGKYETENAYPDVEKLLALTRIYDCSADYLLGISDHEKPLTKQEDAVLRRLLSMAKEEKIITGTVMTDAECHRLLEEMETAQIAVNLFKRIKTSQ